MSTISAGGVPNIAPFSFFNAFGANPVTLGFAVMKADDRAQKDTLANIRATDEFVINIATESTLAALDKTAKPYPPEVDEFDIAGLTTANSTVVRPPRIAQAPINFECSLLKLVPLGEGAGSSTLVLGQALHLHIDDVILLNGKIDSARLAPIARMGGPFYARPHILPTRRSDS